MRLHNDNKNNFSEGKDWYHDRYESVKVERNRYFLLLIICLIALGLSIIANLMLSPLKTVVPYVIEIDKSNGITSVLKPGADEKLSQNQAVTIYFLYKYLNARMNYDWALRQNNADIVRALSTAQSYREYARFMDVNNPQSPIRKFANNQTINTHIVSHSFPYENIAEIHFYTDTLSKSAVDNKPLRQYWIATLKYTFANNSLNLSDRENINPLGFFVTNFQLNQETPGGSSS